MKVYTQGSFDILHAGHLHLLAKCRSIAGIGGQLIVGVLTDKAYMRNRGVQPIFTELERRLLIANIRGVTKAELIDNKKTKKHIKKYKPDFVVVGTDWYEKDIYKQYDMKPEDLNHLLIYHPYTSWISSTDIKERIKNGNGH